MSELISNLKAIQRAVGVAPDGVFGPRTAAAVFGALVKPDAQGHEPAAELDERTSRNIATLDAKAQDSFRHFALMAKATAATFGCDYIMISGNRTYAEQDAIYAQGRTAPGMKVTEAKAGQSNHNFAIAGDFGVFRNGDYLDDKNPALAAKVHAACAVHAKALGMEWGGDWKSSKDLPHYEIKTGLTLAQKRDLMGKKGTVLS